MSYADQGALATDPAFQTRLGAAVVKESRSRVPDSPIAVASLKSPYIGITAFTPWVTSEPGFDVPNDAITDAMLLSAIQAVWADVDAQELLPQR